MQRSSSYTRFAGILPSTILQNRQSVGIGGSKLSLALYYIRSLHLSRENTLDADLLSRGCMLRRRQHGFRWKDGCRSRTRRRDAVSGSSREALAEALEGLLRDRLRVGDDAVDGLLSVDVGGVLDGAAEGVFDGRGEKRQSVQHKQQDGEAGPVVLRVDMPARAVAAKGPLRQLLPEKEGHEQQKAGEDEAEGDVMQGVVAELVAEDGGELVRRGVGDGGIPEDEALGGAEAGDVGVEAGDLAAGVHVEHPVGRKADAAAGDDLLQLLNEGGVRLLERLELVEERIDEDRREEDSKEDRRHRRNPEPEPPAGRAICG